MDSLVFYLTSVILVIFPYVSVQQRLVQMNSVRAYMRLKLEDDDVTMVQFAV